MKIEKKQDTYEYKNLIKQHDMLVNAGEPGFFYFKSWYNLYNFLCNGPSFIFIVLLLLLIISPVFSNKYSSGMDSIIFSSKNGRTKVITAKILACLVFTIVSIIAFNSVCLLIYLGIGGTQGWDVKLNHMTGFATSPYNLNMFQFFFVQLLIQLVGCIVLSAVIIFISSKMKSVLSSFFISKVVSQ